VVLGVGGWDEIEQDRVSYESSVGSVAQGGKAKKGIIGKGIISAI